MNTKQRLNWLQRVLMVKVIFTFLLWGLPTLLGPPAFLAMFGIETPSNPIFLRLFGAVVIAIGVAYWYAYKDPLKNLAIVKMGIVDNGLVTLTIIVLGLTVGISSWFIWVSAALTMLFFILFICLMPRVDQMG